MVKIAVAQMVSSREVDKSLAQADHLIRHAAATDVCAIFLPENFAALGHQNPAMIGRIESLPNPPIQEFLASLSKELGLWIFAGTLPISIRPDGKRTSGNRVRAASLVYNDQGAVVQRYDKIHMFDVDVSDKQNRYRESDVFEPGETLNWVDSPLGRVGLTVCYDLRFPVMYQQLMRENVSCFAIPCAFTVPTGSAHFRILMQARAIENFAYTIAACQGGGHDSGRETYGHSMVVSPWGEVIAEAQTGEDLLIAELDFGAQKMIRADMPIQQQARSGIDF